MMKLLNNSLVAVSLFCLMGVAFASESQPESTSMLSAKEVALSNSLTWRRSGMRHLYERMDTVRNDADQAGRWSVKRYQNWEQGEMSCDHRFVLLGVDHQFSDHLILGSTMDFGKGSSYYTQGSSATETMGASVYGTYRWEDGSYVGGLLKLGVLRLKSLFSGAKEENSMQGLYLGAEYGRRMTPWSRVVFDPQVRLTYSRLGSEGMEIHKTDVQYDAIENLVVALRLKSEVTLGESASTYFLLGYYRDLLGRVSGRYLQAQDRQTFTDSVFNTWGRASFGADYQVDDRITASIEAEKTFGREYQDHTRLSCSARYRF